jgi:toxin FitB
VRNIIDTKIVIIDRAILVRKAKRIKVPDAIIAATALEKECSLITRNVEDFKGIAGLVVIDPHSSSDNEVII